MQKNKQKKFLISGYIGFQNFGDDAILKVLVDDIIKCSSNAEIVALSSNPDLTEKQFSVRSIKRFDLINILKEMQTADYFISSGGSLLQDVTSLQSLIYYLGIIALALLFRTKVFVYAQGVGPINSKIGKYLTEIVLKRVNYITVRDADSKNLLDSLGVDSILTSDAVWRLESKNTEIKNNYKIRVGVQLRSWPSLSQGCLESIAMAINDNFNPEETIVTVLPLQSNQDQKVSLSFVEILKSINNKYEIEIMNNLDINETVNFISKFDYFISMRFHANLISIKYNVPTLAVSYDPKVESLAKEADIPYVDIKNLIKINLSDKIQKLIHNKSHYIENLKKYSELKQETSRQSFNLLSKMVLD